MEERRPPSRLWVGVALAAALLLMLGGQWIFRGQAPAGPEAARAHLEQIQDALDRYRADRGAYPTTAEGLVVLRGHYLPAGVPRDPWGRPYHYLSPGRNSPNGYDLYTFGADGRPGGDDDLVAAARSPVALPRPTVTTP